MSTATRSGAVPGAKPALQSVSIALGVLEALAAAPELSLSELARRVDRIGLVYLHLAEADWDDAPAIPDAFRTRLRDAFSGRIVVAGGYTPERAERILTAGHADLVAFGRPFVANPDLPARIATGAPAESRLRRAKPAMSVW